MSSSKEFDDIMQSTIQETIIAYTSKLSEQAGSALRASYDDMLRMARASADRASTAKSLLANFDTLNTATYRELSAIDQNRLSDSLKNQVNEYKSALSRSDGLFSTAVQTKNIAAAFTTLGKHLGSLVSAIDLITTLADQNATEYTVGEKAFAVGAGMLTGAVIAIITTSTAAAVLVAVLTGIASKFAWEAYAKAVGMPSDRSPPFWKSLAGILGLHADIVATSEAPPAIHRYLPSGGSGTLLKIYDDLAVYSSTSPTHTVIAAQLQVDRWEISTYFPDDFLAGRLNTNQQGAPIEQFIYMSSGAFKKQKFDPSSERLLEEQHFNSSAALLERNEYQYDASGNRQRITTRDADDKITQVSHLDPSQQVKWIETYNYDENGNVTAIIKSDANGVPITDTEAGTPSGPVVPPSGIHSVIDGRDAFGRTTHVTHFNSRGTNIGAESLAYDVAGRIVSFRLDSAAYTNQTAYSTAPTSGGYYYKALWNPDGTLGAMLVNTPENTSYPVIDMMYRDDGGRTMTFRSPDGRPLMSASFDTEGRFTSSRPAGSQARVDYASLPNGEYTLTKYDDSNRLTQIAHYRSDGTEVSVTSFRFGQDGSPESKTVLQYARDTAGFRQSTTYDNRERVIERAKIGDGNVKVEVEQYRYNADGSRDVYRTDGMGNMLATEHYDAQDLKQSSTIQFRDAQGRLHVKITNANGRFFDAIHANPDPRSPIIEQNWLDDADQLHVRVPNGNGFRETFNSRKFGRILLTQLKPGGDVYALIMSGITILPPGAAAISFNIESISLADLQRLPLGVTPPSAPNLGTNPFLGTGGTGKWMGVSIGFGTDIQWSHYPQHSDNPDFVITLPNGIKPKNVIGNW
ncbi:RHS repeat protein [Burkholderia anthina]|uniref:RHS repeat protein n=1 Tax=Burkholderia anthina TaxID=179879 RepID=UPI00158DEFB8